MKSKRSFIPLIFFIAASMAVPSCGYFAEPPASTTVEPQQAGAVKSNVDSTQANRDYWQNVGSLMQKALAAVSQLRGLAAPDGVEFRVETAAWAQKTWGDDFVRENARKIEIDERIYRGLFILPDTVRLASLYAAWPRSYLAAASGEKLYFIQENFAGLSGEDIRKVLSHEVVHLLQSKYFQTPELATFDREKAWAGLTEGDADFTRSLYLKQIGGEKPPQPGRLSGVSPQAGAAVEIPAAFSRLLYFSYKYGEAFVAALHDRGGWELVNEAFRKPPATTQQVMHPEKYLSGQAPASIGSPGIAGWQAERTESLGEFFVQVMLESWLDPSAASVASGWTGDRLDYYEQPQAYLFSWQTLWDSEQSASQFSGAFAAMLQKLGGKQENQGMWQARGEYLSVRRVGQGVTIAVSYDRSMINSALQVGF